MIASIKITTGAGLFVVWYIVLSGAAAVLAGATVALVYALSLLLSGLLTLGYDEQILQRSPLWKSIALGGRKRRLHIERFAEERVEIIKELDARKDRYIATEP